MAFRPTDDQLAAIVDLNTLLDYVGMSGDQPQRPRPEEALQGQEAQQMPPQPLASPKQSFLSMLDFEPNQLFRLLAMCGVEAFEDALGHWRFNDQPISVGLRTKAALAHKTARCICRLEQ